MLGLSYVSWIKACEMVQAIDSKAQKSYLQLYPFSLIDDWEKIKSEKFFDGYIKSALFLEFDSTYIHPVRYMQKGDGSLRRTNLVSPLNYLILLAFGCEVESSYRSKRKVDDASASIYCSSTFDIEPTEQYKKSYAEYTTSRQVGHTSFTYYLKIDITNYYDSIDINRLFKVVEDAGILDARSSLLLSTFIKMIGNGKFPIVDGHGGLSYLATSVYLDELDFLTQRWLNSKNECEDYRLVRYVDDLYIFFDVTTDEHAELFATDLLDFLRDLYVGFGLCLNESKQIRIERTSEVADEVTNSFYDIFVNGIDPDYVSYYSKDDLLEFFQRIYDMPKHASSEDFDYALDAFKKNDLKVSRSDILNGFIYYNREAFEDEKIINQLSLIVLSKNRFLKLSVKQLVVSVLNTEDGNLIRSLLNQIFANYRNRQLTKYDEIIILEYLVQRNFQHSDLKKLLAITSPDISRFAETYCSYTSMGDLLTLEKNSKAISDSKGYSGVYENDSILHFLMLMFKFNSQQDNLMVAHSFLKSYFDRYVAILSLFLGIEGKKNGTPDYKHYYTEGAHKAFLKANNLEENTNIISKLSKLRNVNPVNHSSAEMLRQVQAYKGDYQQNISDIVQLMNKYREHLLSKT